MSIENPKPILQASGLSSNLALVHDLYSLLLSNCNPNHNQMPLFQNRCFSFPELAGIKMWWDYSESVLTTYRTSYHLRHWNNVQFPITAFDGWRRYVGPQRNVNTFVGKFCREDFSIEGHAFEIRPELKSNSLHTKR